MKEKGVVLAIVIFLGLLNFFLGGAVFLALLFGIMLYFIYRNSPNGDKRFIVTILAAGFLLRIVVAVALHAVTYLDGYHCISGDDLLYTAKSLALVYKWEGMPDGWIRTISASPKHGLNPFLYVLAGFYKFFGFHPVTSKIINCGIGSLIGWASYLTAKEIFDRRAARISLLVVTFYPSLIRWSAANLKDPMIIFLFIICIYGLMAASCRKIKVWKLIVLGLSAVLFYQFTARSYFVLVIFGLVIAIFFRISGILKGKQTKVAAAAFVLIIALAAATRFVYVKPDGLRNIIYQCEAQQHLTARSDYAGYHLYPGDFMQSLNKGIVPVSEFLQVIFMNGVYFMLTPFPWQMTSKERLAAFPQMIVWYCLLIVSIFGLMRLFTAKPKVAFQMFIVLVFGVTINALAEGNIGSAFRHRDIFTPLIVILASPVLRDLALKDNKWET